MSRCRQCRATFQPTLPLQVVCSWKCAAAYAGTERARKAVERAKRREAQGQRLRVERAPDAARRAQATFNRWVRHRDSGLPCVSCGHPDDGTRQRHASHYRPVGPNPALRFEPDNVHASCSICNNWKSGNLTGYRAELIHRVGLERVEWLEGPHELPKRTVEDYRAIHQGYLALIRTLKNKQRGEHEEKTAAA